jgi:hypothetical protein
VRITGTGSELRECVPYLHPGSHLFQLGVVACVCVWGCNYDRLHRRCSLGCLLFSAADKQRIQLATDDVAKRLRMRWMWWLCDLHRCFRHTRVDAAGPGRLQRPSCGAATLSTRHLVVRWLMGGFACVSVRFCDTARQYSSSSPLATGYRQQAAGYRLQATGHRLQAAGCRLQATNQILPTICIGAHLCLEGVGSAV